VVNPIRIFVAATPGEWLPMRVLEFSLRETSAQPIEVRPIASFGRAIPLPTSPRNYPRTPFSFQRFLIPELCNHGGRAIYLDADMQVFTDIAGLWNQPMQEHDLLAASEGGDGRKGQFSVMLLDCARLPWHIEDIVRGLDDGKYTYEQLMHDLCIAASVGLSISSQWNSLERFESGATRLLHYTDMNTQPWVATSNPLAHLWVACLRRALAAGFISRTEVEREVFAGHARPSLLAQIDAGMDRPLDLPKSARHVDRFFIAPYHYLNGSRARRAVAAPLVWLARRWRHIGGH